MMSTTLSFQRHSTISTLILCGGLVALADIFFYNHGGKAGSITGVYMLLLIAGVLSMRPRLWRNTACRILAMLSCGQAIAAIIQPEAIGIGMYLLLISALALRLGHDPAISVLSQLAVLWRFCWRGWLRLARDVFWMHLVALHRLIPEQSSWLRLWVWCIPLAFSAVFIWLFAEANPVLQGWLRQCDWRWLSGLLSLRRLGFWLLWSTALWKLLRPRIRRSSRKPLSAPRCGQGMDRLFHGAAIGVSLCVFNTLFLIQNTMDVYFIWTGADLPEGMSYAQYAHQGAYPLIATTMLAALYVLVALRPRSTGEASPRIRMLVYVWIGQNMFLACSSILRLLGYIEAYALTGWRVAALLWMGLVMCGLLLIILRLYHRKSGEWLIRANLLCAFMLLYLVPFIHIDRVIADYNVRHCREVTGKGSMLDQYYLNQLGTSAIPAMQWVLEHAPDSSLASQMRFTYLPALYYRIEGQNQDWRRWTARSYLLSLMIKPELMIDALSHHPSGLQQERAQ